MEGFDKLPKPIAIIIGFVVWLILLLWFLSSRDFEPLAALILFTVPFCIYIVARKGKETAALPESPPAPPGTPPNITPLARQMEQTLGLDDLRELCLELGLDYENLAGETKKVRIHSLILEMERHGRTTDLINALQNARPNFSWQAPTAISPHDIEIRRKFLQNVRATWIDGILYQSVSEAIAIELNLTYRQDATTRKTLHIPGQAERPLEKPIAEVFEDYGRSLLILGAPGSGKTITLLQLAEGLVKGAQGNPGEKRPSF